MTEKNDLNLPHDAYFKAMMSDVSTARDFIRSHLPPDVLARLDLSDLVKCPETYVDRRLLKSLTDIAYLTRFDEEEALVCVLVEQLSAPKASALLQTMRYVLSLAENYMNKHKINKAPVIIPLLLYNGQSAWPYTLNWLDLFGKEKALMQRLLCDDLIFVDLTKMEDKAMYQHASAALMEWCLKHARERHLMEYVDTIVDFCVQAGIFEAQKVTQLVQHINYMLYNMDEHKSEAFISVLTRRAPPETREVIMNLATRLENKGRQEGRQEGVTNTLEAILLIKSGSTPAETIQEKTGLTLEEIARLRQSIVN